MDPNSILDFIEYGPNQFFVLNLFLLPGSFPSPAWMSQFFSFILYLPLSLALWT
jgi:hypothetical protein